MKKLKKGGYRASMKERIFYWFFGTYLFSISRAFMKCSVAEMAWRLKWWKMKFWKSYLREMAKYICIFLIVEYYIFHLIPKFYMFLCTEITWTFLDSVVRQVCPACDGSTGKYLELWIHLFTTSKSLPTHNNAQRKVFLRGGGVFFNVYIYTYVWVCFRVRHSPASTLSLFKQPHGQQAFSS